MIEYESIEHCLLLLKTRYIDIRGHIKGAEEELEELKRLAEIGKKCRHNPKDVSHTEAFQSYFSAGDESEALCPSCECLLDDYDWEHRQFNYCPECGQRLLSRAESEEK
jgi:predicted RNA-binding Zn-ribbon protein involved in translation (DUF1610 family)